LLLADAGLCKAQSANPQPSSTKNFPNRLVIGEQSFIDVGPPFDFYQIYLLRSDEDKVVVKRLTLAPGSGTCMPPTVESAEGVLPGSLAQLLSNKNPCSISEKALHREAKRCKHCLVFSGAHVTMQVACGNTNRLIRYEVLDRDVFEEHPNTPEHTSKTFELLSRINSTLGNDVMDRPIFSTEEQSSQRPPQSSLDMTDLANGKFDSLFMGAADKPSLLYAEAQRPSHPANVSISKSMPVAPKNPTLLPTYPPIAKAAHVEGDLVLELDVAADGNVNSVSALSGPLMLQKGTVEAARQWVFRPQWDFPKPPQGFRVTTTVSYRLNCGETALH
jgi:protein TonB